MTEGELVRIMRKYLEGLFPKVCPGCLRYFPTFNEYLSNTEYTGSALPQDDWDKMDPIANMTYSKCNCGAILKGAILTFYRIHKSVGIKFLLQLQIKGL